jgi:putative oxidoreductase
MDWQKFRASWTPRMLSVLRVVISLLFLEHGSQKLFGFPGTQPFNAPPAFSLFWIAGVLEFFGGTLLLLGIFTRFVAFILCGEMAVAYFMAHFPHGFSPLINHGELAVAYCFVFLFLVFSGGGDWSLDALRAKKPDTGASSGG